ncbi:MAG TPA: ATP-binding protein [Gemmataceae bacterium]|nr:ATP-binding protein [Gemmataceae bacterium]
MDHPDAHRPAAPPEVEAAGPGILPTSRGEASLVMPPPLSKTLPGRPQQLLVLACQLTRASWGGIGLVSVDGELVEHFSHGIPEETAAEMVRSSWVVSLIESILRRRDEGSGVRGQEFSLLPPGGERERGEAPLGLPPTGPFLGVPLYLPGRCRGALYLARGPEEPAFGPEDEELIQPICTWLEQGRLFEEAHFHAQMQLLNRVAQSAAGSLDLKRILSGTLRELDRHLPLHVCAVWLIEEKPSQHDRRSSSDEDTPSPDGPGRDLQGPVFLSLAEVSTASPERARSLGLHPGRRVLLEQTPLAACVREGQALYTEWDGGPAPSPQGSGVRGQGRGVDSSLTPDPCLLTPEATARSAACFAVPLRAGRRVVGVLQSLLSRPAGFTRDQIQLLYLVADLLGPAISNCQLFGRLRAAYEELRLTQSQLIQAEKMRALGELASGMAHEFNNSLCGVLGFLELVLLNKGLDPTTRGYLESARTCALDATETVRRVQDFARRQQDGLSIKVLDLNELVRQTLELIRHKWENLDHARKPINVCVQTEATGRVAGSPTELREVLTNLVFNAVDAMPQGGTLTVRTWSTATDAYLAVQDTGVGIAPAVRHRLFEPFFTTKGERGNGLGLSVVFGIVRRHRGEITVDSELGQGSTFTVRLPLAPANAAVEEAPPREPAANAPGGLRVLVIEDDDNVRDFLGYGLTALGHRPRLAADGREGLDAFSEERFDVVLTDLGLPGLSGEEIARRVAEQSPGTPVVVLTGWADQLRAEKGSLQGVAGVLGKPVALDALASTLATVCPARS